MKRRHKLAALAAVALVGVGGSIWANWNHHYYPHTTTTTSPSATFQANLFTTPPSSGVGTPNCVWHSLETYTQALSNNAVCSAGLGNLGYSTNSWNNACKAAAAGNTTSGTIVGVKAGTYIKDASDGALMKDTDCSGGKGANVNPNCTDQNALTPGQCASTGTTTAWVKYECADGSATKNVDFNSNSNDNHINFMYAKFHAAFIGGCFSWATIQVGQGGQVATRRAGELQFVGGPGCATNPGSSDCQQIVGADVRGGIDVLFENQNSGPWLLCTKNDPAISTARWKCDPNNAYWGRYATFGTATSSCGVNDITDCGGSISPNTEQPETYTHNGDSSTYANIRYENVYMHDSNQVFTSGLAHSGCFMMDNNVQGQPYANLVFDHVTCERVESVGFQDQDSGVLIENSLFGPPTKLLDTTSPTDKWDVPVAAGTQYEIGAACRADQSPGCVLSNVIYRNDVFLGPSNSIIFDTSGATYGTYSGDYVVGCIFASVPPAGVGQTGITTDRNAYFNGVTTAGTNAVSLAAGDPFTNDSITTPGDTWSASSTLNLHLTGTPAVGTFDASALAAVYQTPTDGDENSRTLSAMRYGAYN